jgi:GDP-4-dehydro-6-deoxy-D-mannose reductase
VKVLVTGATGFVGRWLVDELRRHDHDVVALPGRLALDIADGAGLAARLDSERPDAVAHLAGVAFGPDAARDPDEAERVNAGGTRALFSAVGQTGPIPVLVTSSSEVYGAPERRGVPLTEDLPLRGSGAYAISKRRQEEAALQGAGDTGAPVVVTRSFNHTGPGQRAEFVAPAIARRVLEARRRGDRRIRLGNPDVRRDFSDVRDVVRAYRLLLEHVSVSPLSEPLVVNVCSGRSTSIRELVAMIGAAAGVEPEILVDPDLVRAQDPPEIVGDPSRLRSLTGWVPDFSLRQTVGDLVASLVNAGSQERRSP